MLYNGSMATDVTDYKVAELKVGLLRVLAGSSSKAFTPTVEAPTELDALRQDVLGALFPTEGSSLMQFARSEVTRAGLLDQDSDYDGEVGRAVLDLTRVLAGYHPSGGMVEMINAVWSHLSVRSPLSPSDHSEYTDVSDSMGLPAGSFLQDSRDSTWFSQDGGGSWYHVDSLPRDSFSIFWPTNNPSTNRPIVVTLCGSTRFWGAYETAMRDETLAGKVVLTCGTPLSGYPSLFSRLSPDEVEELKAKLDALHLRKIDMSDEILVLNVDGYIGESTRAEIAYAIKTEKRVRYLNPTGSFAKV